MREYLVQIHGQDVSIKQDVDGKFIIPSNLQGGTALKPAWEPVVMVRKPCSEKTVAANVLKYGTGAINLGESRVGVETRTVGPTGTRIDQCEGRDPEKFKEWQSKQKPKQVQGRFPANLVLSCDCDSENHTEECAVRMLNEQSGPCKTGNLEPHHLLRASENTSMSGANQERHPRQSFGGDEATGAARFFYCAKASKADKEAGLEDMPEVEAGVGDDRPSGQSMQRLDGRETRKVRNTHPTVKPTKLMQYLIRMVTPPGGTCLDPFMGSGSTGVAALQNGFDFVGIEKEQEYFNIAQKRVSAAKEAPPEKKVDELPGLFE